MLKYNTDIWKIDFILTRKLLEIVIRNKFFKRENLKKIQKVYENFIFYYDSHVFILLL